MEQDYKELKANHRKFKLEIREYTIKKELQNWIDNGHGQYLEVENDRHMFDICNASRFVVCHFYREDEPNCKIIDKHFKILAKRHMETRFVKFDAEKAPWFTVNLKIMFFPTILLFKQNKLIDTFVGFLDFDNRDDFTTEELEKKLADNYLIIRDPEMFIQMDQLTIK